MLGHFGSTLLPKLLKSPGLQSGSEQNSSPEIISGYMCLVQFSCLIQIGDVSISVSQGSGLLESFTADGDTPGFQSVHQSGAKMQRIKRANQSGNIRASMHNTLDLSKSSV